MGFGNAWAGVMGDITKEQVFELLDTFYDLGGNFIDTANAYQGGQSEQWIGEWLAKRDLRSQIVLSTKYSMNPRIGQPGQHSSFVGTGTKSLHNSIHESLKNLQTDHIDVFYVHAYDYATDIPELMQSLNLLVNQGKVLYLGISDTPAWFVVKANAYARQYGLRPFSIYQGRYSAQQRELERDIIPMCRHEGMAIHAFGVLGGGMFKSPSAAPSEGGRNVPAPLRVGREEKVSIVLDAVAKRHGVPLTSVALAYAMSKTPYLFPVIGGRKIEHLKANIEALGLELTAEDIAEIETGYDFELGFPHSLISGTAKTAEGPQDIKHISSAGYFDYVAASSPIKPHKGELTAAWKA
jgi:aryl-alcohol dehydrogenase-like predicted oxidoreductase